MSDDFSDLFKDLDDEGGDERPPSPGVRITGATPAVDDLLADWKFDEPTTAVPIVERDDASGDAEAATPPASSGAELPHWTENPTGQVPAILSRDDDVDDDPWAQVTSPTWREDESDWEAESERFDANLLSSDDEPLGALNPDPVLEESQPWEFDIAEQAPASEAPRSSDPLDDGVSITAGRATVPPLETDFDSEPATVVPRRRRGATSEPSEPRRSRRQRDRSDAGAAPEVTEHDGGDGGRNLPVAIATGVIIAVLVLVTFDIGTVLAMLLVVVVVTLAAAEAYAAFRRGGEHPATLLGLVAVASLTIATYNRGTQALGLV